MTHYKIIDVINIPQAEAGLMMYEITIEDMSGNMTTTTITTPPGQFREVIAAQYPDAKITYSFDTSAMDEFLDPEQDQ